MPSESKRGGYTPGSYWMERNFFGGKAPEHLRERGERWPSPAQRFTCSALLLNTFVGRGVRPANTILPKSRFDVPIMARAVVDDGPYAGNEVLFYLPDTLYPEGVEANPSPEDFGTKDGGERWRVLITGAFRRYNGYFYTAYVNDPCTIQRLDAPGHESLDW